MVVTFYPWHHHFYFDVSAWKKKNYQLDKVQLVPFYILKYYEHPIDGLLLNVYWLQLQEISSFCLSWNEEYCWLIDWFSKLKGKRFFWNICK